MCFARFAQAKKFVGGNARKHGVYTSFHERLGVSLTGRMILLYDIKEKMRCGKMFIGDLFLKMGLRKQEISCIMEKDEIV